VSVSPTQLTLRKLRADGWFAETVERWVPGANIRRDLFNVLDIVALKDGTTLGVQCTSTSNVSARVHKIADSDALPWLRDAGWQLAVVGWAKKDNRWVCRWVDVS
jgi:hypothetical protein